ncbi:insulinase family protein [Bizionia saleffrena]|uniref:Insulinase family protein n=1 Tax=Bizionia saleffrena TaxID=291189 RepID=A0A8H2LED3_9FLAO|nr:M16 family metallopeptidase [Bizionia saleffrena]TYB76733.1 insulinase family protein [Bizionia saleffrena]
MKHLKWIVVVMLVAFIYSCKNNNNEAGITAKTEVKKDVNGFAYETVANDPTGLRLYTLDNGLKVYLSKNTDEPKIQTYIAVRAGSNYDPKESTGLAHYLEHMVFKGTHKIGSLDWEKEKVYLDSISSLYEQHRAEQDPDKKLALYKQIDEVSLAASQFSVANEYDKMTSSIGATGTNAHTWYEETVYKNKIPVNELDKWLALEEERFSTLVLRLFHTELEAVFEEFNRGQDSDGRKAATAMLEGLFPNHPYGQQSTIGTAEHLKNPSLVDINNYFDTYYVPNNMAMVLVGDIDFEKTIEKVNNTFGKLEGKAVVHPKLPTEAPIEEIVIKEVFGPTSESVSLAFRSKGVNTKEQQLVTLCDMLLANGKAGLIDLNLKQKQLVQSAGASASFFNDYGYHRFYGAPKDGQTLDDVKTLLLDQIELLKKGAFEDWMLTAVINDLKKSQLEEYENNTGLASAYYEAFIHHEKWEDKVSFLNDLKAITKQEIVAFAASFYGENYVLTYKRKGVDNSIVKVSNPGITQVNLNRDKASEYIVNFNATESKPLAPVYVDYKSEIKKSSTESGIEVSYINNKTNDLFSLNFIFDMGANNDKKLELAIGYIDYLGTEKFSAEDLKKEFYKLGIDYSFRTGLENTYVSLSGLKENLPAGLELLESLWSTAKADPEAYVKYVESIAKSRQNNKTNKAAILRGGLLNYAKYGEQSAVRNIIPITEMVAINPQELVDITNDLKNYKQRIFYYGKNVDIAINALNKSYKTAKELKAYPEALTFTENETGGNVYFVDYDMVQSEVMFLAKSNTFNAEDIAVSTLFNNYFGAGLSSIVFQEIRESKALAYSAWANYAMARDNDNSNYLMAYMGTQANKMPEAVSAMLALLSEMPEVEDQFNSAKDATLKKIAAERITKANIFWNYERLQKQGIDNDNREAIYNAIEKMTLSDLKTFFNTTIKGEEYTVIVIGNKKDIDFQTLKKLGEVKEVEADYLFNYATPSEIKS